jgi:thiol-disulfide isomerase/thioredoxin
MSEKISPLMWESGKAGYDAPYLFRPGLGEEFLRSNPRSYLLFSAEWCDPCKSFTEEILGNWNEINGVLRRAETPLALVDEELNYNFVEKRGVLAFPTLHLYKDGRILHRELGRIPIPRLVRILERNIERYFTVPQQVQSVPVH